CTRIAYW
nr:immunoglobulin heavy chain junction region [Mus musculus]